MSSNDTVTDHPATLPRGVELHGKAVRISFMYEGRRRREIVSRDDTDAVSIALAARLRGQVLAAIAAGQFDYQLYFPDSPRWKSLLQGKLVPQTNARALRAMTVKEGVEAWLTTQDGGKAKSTAVNYRSRARHVIDALGEQLLADVTTQALQQFRNHLVRSRKNPQGLSPKTANDVLTVVRGVWADAYRNDITTRNRAEGIHNHVLERQSIADPFSLEEMQCLLAQDPSQRATARMLVCNCWMGLSRSELLALAIEDIDLERKKLKVSRAFVQGEHKSPKELSRTREIDLLEPAIKLLREILADTASHSVQDLEITCLDNLSLRNETVHLLFTNPKTGQPWSQTALDRWFKAHALKVGVRYRGINQCRHTFASRALSKFAPREWVIRQLGHSDGQMLDKHYAKWIPEETSLAPKQIEAIKGAMATGWLSC